MGFSVAVADAEKVLAIERLAATVVVLGLVLPCISLYIISKYEITEASHEDKLKGLGYAEAER